MVVAEKKFSDEYFRGFAGSYYENTFTTGEFFEGETLRDSHKELSRLISKAKNEFREIYGSDFQLPTRRSLTGTLSDFKVISILYTAKKILETYTEKNYLDMSYSDFVYDTFNSFYEDKLLDHDFQTKTLFWLRSKEVKI